MTTPEPPRRETIEPAPNGDPESIADEQFVHGLLSFMHNDSDASQHRRIERLMHEISAPPGPPLVYVRRQRQWWRPLTAVAAGIAIVAAVIFIGLPGTPTAYALLDESIEAGRVAGDRRYEVRTRLPHEDALSAEPIATMDMRDRDHLLVRSRAPEGHMLIVGSNAAGKWTIRRDGSIEQFDPQRAWPRWLSVGERTVMVESVDDLLLRLRDRYELRLLDSEAIEGEDDGPLYDRVDAVLEQREQADPRLIEIWIDPDTRVVRRVAMHWPRRERADGRRGGQPRGDRRGPGMGGPPPPGGRGAGAGRPLMEDRDAPPEGMNERPPSGFIDGPPRFDEGAHRPAPMLLVFDRVEVPVLADDWFDPERHAWE